jgi:hypothetical protein
MRPTAFILAVLAAAVLVAGCGGSTASQPQATPASGVQQAAASSIKPAAPKSSSETLTPLGEVMSKVSVAIFNDSGSNSYRIVATNASDTELDAILEIRGGPENGRYLEKGVKPLSLDTGGLPAGTTNYGGGDIRQEVGISQLNPGQKATVKVAYPAGGTCVVATISFKYKDRIGAGTPAAYCNSESGINAVDIL